MSDHDLLAAATAAALGVYRLAMNEYETRTLVGSSDTEWDGAALAAHQCHLLEQVTAQYPESIALAARRMVIDQFIEAHLGAEYDDETHEVEMRRLRP